MKLAVLFVLLTGLVAQAQSVALTPESTLSFASPAEGAAVLGAKDDFSAATSPLERAVRLGKSNVSEAELLTFMSAQTLPWTTAETTRISRLAKKLVFNLKGLSYSLPREILVVKTTGRDQINAPYTRQNAIVFPELYLTSSEGETTASDDEILRFWHMSFSMCCRGLTLTRRTSSTGSSALSVAGASPFRNL